MTYEQWETFNKVIVLAVLAGVLTVTMMVYYGTRRSVGDGGKKRGRLGLTLLVGAAAFVGLAFVYNLIVMEAYPEYAGRYQNERSTSRVIDRIEGRWRPNNARRTDYFVFTDRTWSSVNPDHDTTITWEYEVLNRDGPCMRIRSTSTRVVEGGTVTRDGPRRDGGDPVTVCVDPDTDMMAMRFDSGGEDILLVRMN